MPKDWRIVAGPVQLRLTFAGVGKAKRVTTIMSDSTDDATTRMQRTIELHEQGIDESQAADLRHRLSSFIEDWDRPEMAAYDELP